MKKNKIILTPSLLKDLNHWRDQMIALEKVHYSKDYDKERTIKNMLNKYLDEVLDYNKKIKDISKK